MYIYKNNFFNSAKFRFSAGHQVILAEKAFEQGARVYKHINHVPQQEQKYFSFDSYNSVHILFEYYFSGPVTKTGIYSSILF